MRNTAPAGGYQCYHINERWWVTPGEKGNIHIKIALDKWCGPISDRLVEEEDPLKLLPSYGGIQRRPCVGNLASFEHSMTDAANVAPTRI